MDSITVHGLSFTIRESGDADQNLLYNETTPPVVCVDDAPLVALKHFERFRDDLRAVPSFDDHRGFGTDTLLAYYHGIDDRSGVVRTFLPVKPNDKLYNLLVSSIEEDTCIVCGDGFQSDAKVVGLSGSSMHAECAPTFADGLDEVWNCTDTVLGETL